MNRLDTVLVIAMALVPVAGIAGWVGYCLGFDAGKIRGWKRCNAFHLRQSRAERGEL